MPRLVTSPAPPPATSAGAPHRSTATASRPPCAAPVPQALPLRSCGRRRACMRTQLWAAAAYVSPRAAKMCMCMCKAGALLSAAAATHAAVPMQATRAERQLGEHRTQQQARGDVGLISPIQRGRDVRAEPVDAPPPWMPPRASLPAPHWCTPRTSLPAPRSPRSPPCQPSCPPAKQQLHSSDGGGARAIVHTGGCRCCRAAAWLCRALFSLCHPSLQAPSTGVRASVSPRACCCCMLTCLACHSVQTPQQAATSVPAEAARASPFCALQVQAKNVVCDAWCCVLMHQAAW